MTVPGLVDDKEKLVFKGQVSDILPNRERLIKIRKRRHILRLIISLALVLLLLSTIFLTICYIKKIGPFRRIFRGFCPVGNEKHGFHKVYESFEITDDYALISVPKFYVKWGSFQSVKTLHLFSKKLTVIQYNGLCFIRPMLQNQKLQKDWFERIAQISNQHHVAPNHFTHIHWRMSHRPFTNEYLSTKVHKMAAAMCQERPVFSLMFYMHEGPRRSCYQKCEDCPISRQFIRWERVNGQQCGICHCKAPERALKSSNHVDPNCKTIRCENKCLGKRLLGCVQCHCADQDVKQEVHVRPQIGIANHLEQLQLPKIQSETELPVFQDKMKLMPSYDSASAEDKPVTYPTFRDLSKQHVIYLHSGEHHDRKRRSANKSNCKIIAEVFEGYTPLDDMSQVAVDYIHDC